MNLTVEFYWFMFRIFEKVAYVVVVEMIDKYVE